MIKTIQKQLILPKQFGLKTQNYLKYFLIFTAWPVFSIGVSITLFLFVFLISEIKSRIPRNFLKMDKNSNKFYFFALIAILSLVFTPWEKIHSTLSADIQLLIQYIYWMMVAVFFMNIYKYMNKKEVNKYIFYGLVIQTVHYFFLNFPSSFPFVRTFVSRNGFVYTVLALWPLASGYVYQQYGRAKGNFSLFLIFFIMLFTDGRAGVVIILIENIFIYFVNNKANAKLIRALLVAIIPLSSILGPMIVNDENRIALGELIEPLSERIAGFVKGEGADGDLTFDKSWLTRKLMIDKGIEIITDYPFLGVGIGHYGRYSARLATLNSGEYSRLQGAGFDEEYYNRKSAHNSYINVLSEMGILGIISLFIILVPIFIFCMKRLIFLTIGIEDMALISLVGICIHFYSITSLPGTVTWLVIGLAASRMNIKENVR